MDVEELAKPEVIAVRGGWMAISAPGSLIKIGAPPAKTKEEAVQHFREIIKAWQSLSETRRRAKM